ncbi:PAS domain S-box protein [uncultured Hyphomonas sp.]|uniref:PAS domain S-box protein n=1 Tax=uncultured Hyphomonas sp. TaxID=225298 RepID=UPI002AAB8630|nr:PAS domain S-box protein [uncultured Hyphomonas sp.]
MSRATVKRIDDASLPPLDTDGITNPLAYGAVGIAHIDSDGTILRCNQRFADMLGYTPEELAGMHSDAVTDADDVELQTMLFREILAGKRRSFQMNKRYFHKDGSVVWAILTVGCARNAEGEVEHFVAIISDVTEKHNTSQALAESEARFRATFENAAVGMAIIGTDGAWLRVNQRVCEIVGYKSQELMKLTFQDITHPDDLDIDLGLLQETIEGKRDNYSMDKRYFHKDGSLIWVKLTVGSVRNEIGEVEYFISVIEDITSEKRKDEALNESEKRFRATFESAAIGMAQVGPDGSWLHANRKVCEILGYSEAELKQRNFQSLTHPEDLPLGIAQMEEMLTGKRSSMQIEKRYIRKDGEIVWANLTVACVRNDAGGVDYMISVIEDITEKKQIRRDLMESETRFGAAQQTMPDGFMIFSSIRNERGRIEDFQCEYGNPAAGRLLAIDPEDMPGHRMLVRNPLNADIGLFDIYCGVVESGRTAQGELQFPFQNGTIKWFRYSIVKVDDGFAVAFTDISDAKAAELKLKESEERFRAAQQTTPDGFLMFGTVHDDNGEIADFVCEYANPAAHLIARREGQDMVGQTLLKDTELERNHPLFHMYTRIVETGEPLETEALLPITKEGRWLRIAAVKIEKGFAVTFSDVTDRKKSELRLQESEARLRAFHQTAPDGFVIFRSIRNAAGEITDFRFVYANPAAQQTSELSEEELKQTTMLAEAPALKSVGVLDKYIDIAETGKPWQGEFFYPGEFRQAWYHVTAVKVDDGIAISYKNISAQKQSEARLREQEERARAILNSLISFVTLLTPDGIILEVNDSALATANLSQSDVVGKYFWDTYWWSHDADAREELRQCVLQAAKGERVRHDTTIRISGDERIAVANLLAPVLDDDGAVTSVVASGFDISDRKKAEQHREMLVDELSHRVKNSLATVQTIASHSLREASDLESFRETFVGRLMAISKCHDLLVDTTRNDADISQLVRDQVLPYAQGGIDRQVTMSGPPLVLGPEAAHTFGLILHELATNAAKYGALSNEQGRLDISWKRGPDPQQPDAVLTWVETGGPVVEPPTRRGFGSVLIEQSLSHALGGKAKIEYRPEGLWAEFRFRKRAQ